MLNYLLFEQKKKKIVLDLIEKVFSFQYVHTTSLE